jgi:pimeloyl-ACP methyl ester carboxylesterase
MNATQNLDDKTVTETKHTSAKTDTTKNNIYLLPGLLADGRIFKNFATGDNSEFHYVVYPEPEKNETLANFAGRLASHITEPNPVLIGTSFGGVLSVEIAKHIAVKQVILIGSVKHQDELAWYKNLIHLLRLHKRVSPRVIQLGGFASRFFAPKETREWNTFFNMVYTTGGDYIHWVIDRVLGWKNTEYPENILHIHGSKDPLFPIRYITDPVVLIKGAGHSMVMDNAKEIKSLIAEHTGIEV